MRYDLLPASQSSGHVCNRISNIALLSHTYTLAGLGGNRTEFFSAGIAKSAGNNSDTLAGQPIRF